MIDGLWEGGRFVLASTIHERERAQAAEIERLRAVERKVAAMVRWLDANQPDVWRRGIWDAINEAEAADADLERLHVALCKACIHMNIGENREARDVVRRALADHAEAEAARRTGEPSESGR